MFQKYDAAKGQLVSKGLFDFIVGTKKTTKYSDMYILGFILMYIQICLHNKVFYQKPTVQCNLNLVTTCDLVTILQRPFFNLLHKIIRFSDIMRFSDSFCRDQKCH